MSGLAAQPSQKTLAKYGLTSHDWQTLWEKQGGACAICRKVPNGRLCIDHEHVKNYKKLPPEQRRLWVRGLLCWYCNHAYCGRGITTFKSRNVTAYLEAHEERVMQYRMAR